MNILKTSLILYPTVPGPRPKHIKTYISSDPIVPIYDLPKWMVPVAFVVLGALVWSFLTEIIEKIMKAIL